MCATAATAALDARRLLARMSFGLRCAYAHGVTAIRTHLDSFRAGGAKLGGVPRNARGMGGRIELQAVSLIPIDYFRGD